MELDEHVIRSHTLSTKVDGPQSYIELTWTPIVKLVVVMCGSKNGYQNNM